MSLESALNSIGSLNDLARGESAVHRLDPRAKVLVTFAYVVAVVSFDRYAVARLTPFMLYPVAMIAAAGLPVGPLWRRLVLASPFAVLVGIFNPLLDREPMLAVGGVVVSGGWMSFAGILLRFALTVSAALVLVAATGFEAVCAALERLGVPNVFAVQLLFMHRYLFVLTGEAARMVRAHALRRPDGGPMRLKTTGSLVGQLLLRTMDRAQRIHTAMLCRGFDGHVPTARSMRFTRADVAFVLGWIAFFAAARCIDLTDWLGRLVVGGMR